MSTEYQSESWKKLEADAKVWEAENDRKMSLSRFQQLVNSRVGPDGEGYDSIGPLLPKSTIYHHLDGLGVWEKAKTARLVWQKWLIKIGQQPSPANAMSWRLLEEILFWANLPTGEFDFDLELVTAELDALIAFGDKNAPDPDLSEAAIAETLIEKARIFGGEHGISHRPTTVMLFLKRLGVWDDAAKMLRAMNGDVAGSMVDSRPSPGWRFLSFDLGHWATVDEIRTSIRDCLNRHRGGG